MTTFYGLIIDIDFLDHSILLPFLQLIYARVAADKNNLTVYSYTYIYLGICIEQRMAYNVKCKYRK